MNFFSDSFIKNAIQTNQALKSNCSLNLVPGHATLGSNNCSQTFEITGKESFTSLCRNFVSLFFGELL